VLSALPLALLSLSVVDLKPAGKGSLPHAEWKDFSGICPAAEAVNRDVSGYLKT